MSSETHPGSFLMGGQFCADPPGLSGEGWSQLPVDGEGDSHGDDNDQGEIGAQVMATERDPIPSGVVTTYERADGQKGGCRGREEPSGAFFMGAAPVRWPR